MLGKQLRVVVVGAVAGGASFAARARRLSEAAEIVLLERTADVSYANCGMPYYIGSEIKERSALNVQTAQSLHQLLNVDVRVNTEAVRIDRAAKLLHVRDAKTGAQSSLAYDKLVIATGASPRMLPQLANVAADPAVFVLRTLDDMDRIKTTVDRIAAAAGHVTVLGGGFIGLEIAEVLRKRGISISIIEFMDQVVPVMDKEMTDCIERQIESNKIDLKVESTIDHVERAGDSLRVQLKGGSTFNTDAILVSVGVTPDSKLAAEAGLTLGARGSIAVNEYMQTSDADIYAVGDVAETTDPILGRKINVPLGGPANREARTAADHAFLGAKAMPYPGTIGTAILRFFGASAGMTGWSEKSLRRENVPFETTTVVGLQHASYFPGAVNLRLKLLWSPADGRLLGAQCAGPDGVDKRIDVLATALRGRMTIDDLCHLELSYAPPFGSAKDIVNIAGFTACNQRDGLVSTIDTLPGEDSPALVVDVRSKSMHDHDLPLVRSSLSIPLESLRARLGEIDRTRPIITVCARGKTSYFAARILQQNGFDVKSFSGGMTFMHARYDHETHPHPHL